MDQSRVREFTHRGGHGHLWPPLTPPFILTALKDRGKVLIPSFVVDRAQRLLFELSLMQIEGLLPEIPIFFDSPMGVRATELYRTYGDTLSGEVRRHAAAGVDLFSPRPHRY